MKTKYATLIRSLLQNYHNLVNGISAESYSVHSDGLQLMELNLQLAKCLEGISASARFNNDNDDFNELHKITLMVFSGNIPPENFLSSISSLATSRTHNTKNQTMATPAATLREVAM